MSAQLPMTCPTCGRPIADPTEDHPGLSVAGAPDTSGQAAKDLTPRSGTLRWLALHHMIVASNYGHGMTDEALSRAMQAPLNTARPRRYELVKLGFLEDRGDRRAGDSGKLAVVWYTTPLARAWWAAWAANK